MKKRIAVTGLGVLSPVGSGHQVFWDALCAGQVGTAKVRAFDTSMFDVHNGGEVRDIDPRDYMKVVDPQSCPRTTQLAIAAARMAYEDAGLEQASYERHRYGVCMGTTMGNASVLEHDHDLQFSQDTRAPQTLWAHYPENYISAGVSEELELEGPCLMVPTACAAGNYAISWGKELIEDGLVDVAVVGGSDAISRACYTTFHRLGAIAPEVCQPFDKNRKGMMVSEGAAVIILEDMERAKERGAHIYAELLGYGLSCDAHHPTAPHPQGLGAVMAIEQALLDAGVGKQSVSYVSAHGTGTKANDAIESIALRQVFQEQADAIPTSSIKSMLGHTMGAASAIEAVTCALSIYHGQIPPTMNMNEPDPECVKQVVPNQAQAGKLEVALSNAFAFGGNISVIVMGDVPA